MAQPMNCDSQDSTAAHFSVTNITTGDTMWLCATCFTDFTWSWIEAVPDFDDRVKAYMIAIAEREEKAKSSAEKRGRRAAKAAGGGQETEKAIPADAATPDPL